jgi:adenylate kinase family enzyme
MIICICGVSGSGKTTLWSTHPMLRQCGIPRADIANIYREFESSGRPINAQQALQYLLQDVRTFFREHQHPQAAVAVEAFFEPRGWQRRQ